MNTLQTLLDQNDPFVRELQTYFTMSNFLSLITESKFYCVKVSKLVDNIDFSNFCSLNDQITIIHFIVKFNSYKIFVRVETHSHLNNIVKRISKYQKETQYDLYNIKITTHDEYIDYSFLNKYITLLSIHDTFINITFYKIECYNVDLTIYCQNFNYIIKMIYESQISMCTIHAENVHLYGIDFNNSHVVLKETVLNGHDIIVKNKIRYLIDKTYTLIDLPKKQFVHFNGSYYDEYVPEYEIKNLVLHCNFKDKEKILELLLKFQKLETIIINYKIETNTKYNTDQILLDYLNKLKYYKIQFDYS